MKIYFKTNKLECLDQCDFFDLGLKIGSDSCRIGSACCQECKYNESTNFDKKYIICSKPNLSNKIKVIKEIIK